jgi:hypothetical protein
MDHPSAMYACAFAHCHVRNSYIDVTSSYVIMCEYEVHSRISFVACKDLNVDFVSTDWLR